MVCSDSDIRVEVYLLCFAHIAHYYISPLQEQPDTILWATRHGRYVVDRLFPDLRSLKGAVQGCMIQHPSRSFALEITLDLVKGTEFFCLKPALHFHVQEEYIESVQGKMDLELDGKEHVLSAGDRPMSIRPYVNHRSYPLPLAQQDDGETVVKFLLSGEKTNSLFELNPVFFEDWYKYQDNVVVNGAKISLVQLWSVSRLSSLQSHQLDQWLCAQ
jgi:hypothetical protein